jgi:hypothetical protein
VLIHHHNVESVSFEDRIIEAVEGVFDVPDELGRRLLGVAGFSRWDRAFPGVEEANAKAAADQATAAKAADAKAKAAPAKAEK